MKDMGLSHDNTILIAKAKDQDIIDACEEVKGILQTNHMEIRATLAELQLVDPNVNQECKEAALISNQSANQPTIEFGTTEVIDRTGRESMLEYALLKGNNGDAMLAVFDSGATKTIIMRKLIENSNIELVKWGRTTHVKGLNNTPTEAQEAEVLSLIHI